MEKTTTPTEAGKQDAERFIKNEQIDYDPFIAISDLHLVRKTVPINYESLKNTLAALDPDLCTTIISAADQRAQDMGDLFSYDAYAEGIAEGVAAVWEKIRDQVL